MKPILLLLFLLPVYVMCQDSVLMFCHGRLLIGGSGQDSNKIYSISIGGVLNTDTIVLDTPICIDTLWQCDRGVDMYGHPLPVTIETSPAELDTICTDGNLYDTTISKTNSYNNYINYILYFYYGIDYYLEEDLIVFVKPKKL